MKQDYFRNGMIAATALASMAVTASAHAGQDSGLHAWAKAAGVSVDEVMKYPKIAIRSGAEGTTNLHVTVDRQGNVLMSSLHEAADSNFINAAAMKVVKTADFPALPAGFDGEELTFSLRLTYAMAGSVSEERALKRQGRVTGREVAGKGAPMMASIKILPSQAD